MVEDWLHAITELYEQGLSGKLALFDLHRIATDHPRADRISTENKQKLIDLKLLKQDGSINLMIRDIVVSVCEGEETSFRFTGDPFNSKSLESSNQDDTQVSLRQIIHDLNLD